MRRAFYIFVILCLNISLALVSAPAQAKPAATISLKASAAKVLIGKPVTLSGKVSGKTKGLTVRLQSKVNNRWITLGSAKLRSSKTYKFNTQITVPTNYYRVYLKKSKRYRASASKIVKVIGYKNVVPPCTVNCQPPCQVNCEPPCTVDCEPLPEVSDSGFYEYPLEFARLDTEYYINVYREENGLEPVTLVPEMTDVAQAWSNNQAATGYVHERQDLGPASPTGMDILDEYVVHRGKAEDFLAYLRATNPPEMLGDYSLLGVGVRSVNGTTGYWTIDFGNMEGSEYVWSLEEARAQILEETNDYRIANGLSPLAPMPQLDTVAQNWTGNMANTTTMAHNPSYSSQYPAGWTLAGENVAYGFDPDVVTSAWINSSGHRANILGDYTHIGIGFAQGPNGHYYYTQNFAKY